MLIPRSALSHEQIVNEFDQWVTPALTRLQDTEKFQDELNLLNNVVDGIVSLRVEEDLTHQEALKALIMHHMNEPDNAAANSAIQAVISTLFLVTASSDNAVKCQYPIHYRKAYGTTYPSISRNILSKRRAPDVIKSKDLISTALRIRKLDWDKAVKLLLDYSDFLLRDEASKKQFAALMDAYEHIDQKSSGIRGSDLLAPLVGFQVRGSVAATGGHDPEVIVRNYLISWGLLPNAHFNVRDVLATELNNWLYDEDDSPRQFIDPGADKTRAFDFILPYFTSDCPKRIFVQSQFYAGDSGSVSHKNVDQASKARQSASELFPDARFVELVDGAGYCASLRNDLRHLLFAADTYDFVQVRSIPVRLRRILQESGVFSPLDIALIVKQYPDISISKLMELLGGPSDSVMHWIDFAESSGWIKRDHAGTRFTILQQEETVSQYVFLDKIIGLSEPTHSEGEFIFIPGFGPNFGTPLTPELDSVFLNYWLDQGVISHSCIR